MNVEKRDGSIQLFDFSKVVRVVTKAFTSVSQDIPSDFLDTLEHTFEKYCQKNDYITTKNINDIIQNSLIKKNKYAVVDSFIRVRQKYEEAREKDMKLIKDFAKALSASDIQNQNANIDEASFDGSIGEAASVMLKNDALKYKVHKRTRKNHEENRSYLHDLDSYSVGKHNCLSIPFDLLLEKGFEVRQCDVRTAKTVGTACQLVAVLFQVQSLQQFGGVSATHLDWTLVPYVRNSFFKHYILNWVYDLPEFYELDLLNMSMSEKEKWMSKRYAEFWLNNKLNIEDFTFDNKNKFDFKLYQKSLNDTIIEVNQSIEGMYHNLNTLQSRSGNQLPFTSINYGTCTLSEGRLIIKSLLENSIKGVGKFNETPIFPCGIFQIKSGINKEPGTPNYDLKKLAVKSTTIRLYPNYANCDWSNQVKWKKADVQIKESVISELSELEIVALIERVKENPTLALNALSLYVENNILKVSATETPIEIFSTMGCRTANGVDINFVNSYIKNINEFIETGKLYDNMTSACQKDGRGNICPATVILPTIAMEAVESIYNPDSDSKNTYEDKINYAHNHVDLVCTEFIKRLNKIIDETAYALQTRFEWIASQSSDRAKFMWNNNTMYGYVKEEGIRSAMKHGTLALGQIAIAETLQILIGCNQTTESGMKLAKIIEQLFSDKCNEWKAKTGLNYGVYYTPAENLCYTSYRKFVTKYGFIPNVTAYYDNEGKLQERGYFTNSIHVPVWEKVDPFEKIQIESQLTGYSTAGCITYIELPDGTEWNVEGVEKIIDYAIDSDIPYFAINIPNDICKECGETGLFDVCPKCGSSNVKHLRRVTGYLTGDYKSAFNKGKQKETEDRVKHAQ